MMMIRTKDHKMKMEVMQKRREKMYHQKPGWQSKSVNMTRIVQMIIHQFSQSLIIQHTGVENDNTELLQDRFDISLSQHFDF